MAKQDWKGGGKDTPSPARGSAPEVPRTSTSRWGRARSKPEASTAKRRAKKQAFAALFALIAVGTLLVIVVGWLNPLPPPKLAVISAQYNTALVPSNASAFNDARLLTYQQQVLDVESVDPDALTQSRSAMLASISGIKNMKPRKSWFGWKKTTAFVYVNALGVALPGNADKSAEKTGDDTIVPYLIPADFQIPTHRDWTVDDLNLIPVSEVIAAAVECPADRKILIFDCQRFEHWLPVGVLQNEFVQAVESELTSLKPAQKRGLYVVFSSSPGELTWRKDDSGQTAFGYFLTQGLTGAADSGGNEADGRITLQELFSYVSREVTNWADEHRSATQTPLLKTFGASERVLGEIVLASLDAGKSKRSPPVDETVSLSVLRTQMESAWKEYYEALRLTPSPNTFAPAQWNAYESTLLRAEEFLRAGNLRSASLELQTGKGRKAFVDQAMRRTPATKQAYSMALNRFLQKITSPPKVVDPQNDLPPAETKIGTIVRAVEEGRLSVELAVKQFNDPSLKTEQLPVEAHLIYLLDESQRRQKVSADPAALDEEMSAIIKQRILAEQAAAPLHWTTPEIRPWIESRIDDADGMRRFRQDWFFSRGSRRVAWAHARALITQLQKDGVDDPAQRWHDNANTTYEQVVEDTVTLQAAIQLRQQLLSELPHLVKFLEAPVWKSSAPGIGPNVLREGDERPSEKGTDTNIRADVSQATTRLLAAVRQLSSLLDDEAPETNTGKKIADISALVENAAKVRKQLLGKLSLEATSLTEQQGPPSSPSEWHRISNILCIPFAVDPEGPAISAGVRWTLLDRLKQSIQVTQTDPKARNAEVGTRSGLDGASKGESGQTKAGDQSTVPQQATLSTATAPTSALRPPRFSKSASGKRLIELGMAAGRLYSLAAKEPFDSRLQDEDDLDEIAREVASAWIELIDPKEQPAENELDRLRYSETSSRVVNGSVAMLVMNGAALELREEWLARYFAWQASRFAGDFLAGGPNENEPFYLRSSRGHLDLAESYQSGSNRAIDNARKQINALEKAATKLNLSFARASVYFRGTDEEQTELSVQPPADFPEGIGGLSVIAEKKAIGWSERQTAKKPEKLQYTLRRRDRTVARTDFTAKLFFRGHGGTARERDTYHAKLDVKFSREEDGATVEYRRDTRPYAELFVDLKKVPGNHVKLLFLVDCSSSMGEAISAQDRTTRMGRVRDILTKFANGIPNRSLDVGVRLFGHRFKITDTSKTDPAAWKRAQDDTQLVLPIGRFNRQSLKAIVSTMAPKGETPLYQALLKAKDDFNSIRTGKKIIIVISDGADRLAGNALLPKYPKFAEVEEAYKGIGITVNAIGFNVAENADFALLKRLAALPPGGRHVVAEEAKDLFTDVTGLAGFLEYGAYAGEQRYPQRPGPLRSLGSSRETIRVPPGTYEIRVSRQGREDSLVAEAFPLTVESGARYDLEYDSGELSYAPRSTPPPLLKYPSGATKGTVLAVQQAKLENDVSIGFEFSLSKPENAKWFPEEVSLFVRPRGSEKVYTFHDLPANITGQQIPAWQLRLDQWPEGTNLADVEVRWWNPFENPKPKPTSIAWGAPISEEQLPAGIRITQRIFGWKADNDDGHDYEKEHRVAKVVVVFPQDQTNMQEWSIGFEKNVVYSRQIYDTVAKIYTGYFVLEGDAKPGTLLIHPPHLQQDNRRLKTPVRIGIQRINGE